jgi:chromosome segregation ATPase
MGEDTIQDIKVLRSEVNARLTVMENCIERLTTAVERLSENRERLMVLETRVDGEIALLNAELRGMKSELADIRDTVRALSKKDSDQEIRLGKLDMVKAAAIAVASAAMTFFVTKFLRGQ